jgi:hypothetical protein
MAITVSLSEWDAQRYSYFEAGLGIDLPPRRAKQLRANEMASAGVKSLSQPQSAAAGVMQRISNRRDVAQPGRALAWGARGRQFKSARPDQSIAVPGFV